MTRCMWLLLGAAATFSGCTLPLDLGGGSTPGASTPFAGPRASCVLASSGRLRCFGAGGAGQLGIEPDALHSLCAGEPCDAIPHTFPLADVSSVALGDGFTCVVLNAQVWCAGANALGTLGRGTRDADAHVEPLLSDVAGAVVEIVAGRHHACARREAGTVTCWGLGSHGALGVDPTGLADCGVVDASSAARLELDVDSPLRCTATPVDVPGVSDAVALRAGPFATCVLRASGDPFCFGRNLGGALGVGDAVSEVVATPSPLALAGAVDVSLGARHGCAIDASARTHCFGLHDVGQLGVGSAAPDLCGGSACALGPLRVTDLEAARSVHAGDEHTCVLLEDDALRCFGSDALGQVGNSMGAIDDCAGTPCARTPRSVAQVDGVERVAAAGDHTLIVTLEGTPMAFGGNTWRECANTNPEPITWPQEVYGVGP